jgi:hypothetical protein
MDYEDGWSLPIESFSMFLCFPNINSIYEANTSIVQTGQLGLCRLSARWEATGASRKQVSGNGKG